MQWPLTVTIAHYYYAPAIKLLFTICYIMMSGNSYVILYVGHLSFVLLGLVQSPCSSAHSWDTLQSVDGYFILIPYTLTYGIRAVMLGLTCLLDRLMYGSWILVPLNFLKFNFLSSGGDYYGTHKWHWYFSSGFPVMIFTFMPFSFYGIMKSKCWKLCGLIVWVLAIYSLLGHKEFR